MKKKIFLISIAVLVVFLTLVFYVFQKLSSEVLEAFGTMNEKFERTNTTVQNNLDSLKLEVSYTDYADKMKVLDSISDDLNNHIDYIKSDLLVNLKEPLDYSEMDKSTISDAFFFTSHGNSSEGQKFLNKVDDYKKEMQLAFQDDFPEIVKSIDSKFNDSEDINDWLAYNFKGFPIIAVITKLTSMQSDIQQTKQDLLMEILSQ